MKIGKNLILIIVLSLMLSFGATTSAVNKSYELQYEEVNECNCKIDSEFNNVEYIDGKYPVLKQFPSKSERSLSLIDPDPQPTMALDDLPNQFSWKSYGGDWTTGARDQANCGSCWAFSALAAMEASINIASGSPNTDIDLSEQYILSCLSGAGSCNGGWMSDAIDYIQSTSSGSYGNGINGCPIESCMPYQAVDYIPCDSKCNDWDYYTDPPASDNKLFQIQNFGVTTTSEDNPSDWAMLKTWIMTYGPLSVDILATGFGSWGNSNHDPNDVYQNDNSGVTNHGVLLVGWVDNPDILNGGYWIIKNSWGSGWGYGGFGNIAYGCNGVATRDCVWVTTTPWPYDPDTGGIPDIDIAVFADFDYESEDGTRYPHLGDEIEFTDTSEGDVNTWKWDFDGDGVIDSTKKRPTWTYNQEGDYDVTLTVGNQWGLTSSKTRTIGAREIWPPHAVCDPESYPESPGDNDLEIFFDARYSTDRDGGKITGYHWDFGDGTTSNEQNLYHTFPEPDKIYEVTLTVTDDDGASESTTCIVKIDQNVPPETEILHRVGSDGADWYSGTERISFTASDWTKVIFTYFRIDGGEWERYIPEEQWYYPVSGEGIHTIEAYSIDYYHNEETPVTDTFGIDKTEPTVSIDIEGQKDGDWYITPVTITLTASDELSGLDAIYYKKNLGAWEEYNGKFTIDNDVGSVHVSYMSQDNAGNTLEKITTINFEPPPSAPEITGKTMGSPGKEYEYSFSSTDYYPLDDEIFYFIDWGDGSDSGWLGPYQNGEELTLSHSWPEQKSYILKAKAKDSYNAESDWATLHVSMPRSRNIYTSVFENILELFPNFSIFLKYFFNSFS